MAPVAHSLTVSQRTDNTLQRNNNKITTKMTAFHVGLPNVYAEIT